jgi:tetratricopeptide (TPR) repeat protein
MGRRIGHLAMGIITAALLIGQGVAGASLADKFEVSKTKLLFLLGAGQFEQALAYGNRVQVERLFDTDASALNVYDPGFGGPIRTRLYAAQWHYWLGVASARNNLLADAAVYFDKLDPDLLSKLSVQFEYGIVLLRQKNYPAANRQLAGWVERRPQHNQGRYYLALTWFELGNYGAASQLLNELDAGLSQVPRAGDIPVDQVLYLRASSLFREARYKNAKAIIQRLLNQPERSRYHDAAQDLLTTIGQIERANKRWGAKVALGSAYDSNVTLIPEPEQSDSRGEMQLGSYYKLSPSGIGRYNLFVTRHAIYDDYDLMAHSLSFDGRVPLADLNVRAGYRLGLNLMNQAVWLTSHSLFSQWQHTRLAAQLNVTANRYADSATESGYSATLNAQWRLPMLHDGAVRPKLGASLSWLGNEAIESQQVQLGGFANIEIVVNNWLFRPEVALDNKFYSPDAAVTRQLVSRATLFVDKAWTPQFHSSLKADLSRSATTPSNSGYSRNSLTAQLGWSF